MLKGCFICLVFFIVSDLEPDFPEILDEEPSSSSQKTSTKALRRLFFPNEGNSKEQNTPLDYIYELDQIHTNEVDSPR